jgi:hypothetical protein
MEQEEDPRTPLYTFVAYLLLGILPLIVILLVLVPFFLEGLHLSQAVGVHYGAAGDFSWYPMYGNLGLQSAPFQLGAFTCVSTPCIVVPLLVGALWELILSWPVLRLLQKVLRLMVIIPVALTLAVLVIWFMPLLEFTLGWVWID